LIEYRAFRNTDPPGLAELWRSQGGHGGLMQPMSASAFDRYVLSKPTFDREGLSLALEGQKVVGFAHAGFGPSDDRSTLSSARGVISLVLVRPDAEPAVACELLARSERYLVERGAKQIFGGGSYPLAPFYFGLYGGSEPSGVLASDERMRSLFRDCGYREVERSLVLRRELASFRPVVDRRQMQIRRQTTFETLVDPPPTTWWDAMTFEPFESTRCQLVPRAGGAPIASVDFWNMETMVGTLGAHAVGIVGLQVPSGQRRQGLAQFLLGEAFRQLHAQGTALAEVHVQEQNAAAAALFRAFGFAEVESAALYCKD
jgi:ribosomal protein S18 acetylase RimI-like enzyme